MWLGNFKLTLNPEKIPSHKLIAFIESKEKGGILVKVASITKVFNYKIFFIYNTSGIQFYWKPYAQILGKGKKGLIEEWYQVNKEIENFNEDILSGKLRVVKTLKNHDNHPYLLLNKFITR